MSEDVTCDGCGKTGWRRRFTLAPDDWFYAEIPIFAEAKVPSEHTIVLACSQDCKLIIWKRGPGRLETLSDAEFASLHPRMIEDDVWRILNGFKDEYLSGHQYDSREAAWEAINVIRVRGYL